MPDELITLWQFFQVLAVGVVGGGSGAAVVWYALVERLRTRFASVEDLERERQKRVEERQRLNDKIEGVKTVAFRGHEIADDAKDQVRILQERQDAQAQRIGEVLVEPLQKLTDAVEKIRVSLAEYGRDMRSLSRGLDELRGRIERSQQ